MRTGLFSLFVFVFVLFCFLNVSENVILLEMRGMMGFREQHRIIWLDAGRNAHDDWMHRHGKW